MRKRINISKDFLYQAYIVNKKTTYQIAIEVGCSRTTICNYLRKFGINIGRTYKTGKNHPFFGKHHSELTKKNIAKKLKGRKYKKKGIFLYCKQCGKSFYIFPGRKNKAKYCSRKCQHQALKRPNLALRKTKIKKICIICNKHFEVWPSLNRLQCCSMKCQGQWRTKTFQGKNSPMYGKHLTDKTKKKISIATRKAMRRPEIQAKTKNTQFKKGQHPSTKTEFKKGNKFPQIIELKRISNSIKGNNKKTKPEIKTENLLNKILPNEYKYTGNGDLMIEFFNPDFVNKGNNKVIEVFGDYWHNLPKKKRRDYYRFKVYKRNNYKTLIIWEHELKDIDKITNKILEFNNGQTTRKTV